MKKIYLSKAKNQIARHNTIRDINRQIVLNYVRVRSPISRACEGLRSGSQIRSSTSWARARTRTSRSLPWPKKVRGSGPGRRWLFLWALRVNVHIPEEGRNKTSEVVIGRPDVSAVLLYRADPDPLRTRVVLVREFRSAARNTSGMVLELPSGSSFDDTLGPLQVAAEEVHEETGLRVAAERLRPVAARQVAATLLGHHAHVYALELSEEEMAWLERQRGEVRGAGPSERTYVEVRRLGELLVGDELDWSTLGMILAGLRG